jgi:transcriptional regulator with XRE-family HTH domain
MLVRRLDSVVLLPTPVRRDAAVETPEGFVVYDALFARVGNQDYDDGRGGIVVEHRPESEVFDEDSLASYFLRPLTDLHPPQNLDAKTARFFARGATDRGRRHTDGIHVAGTLAVWDAKLEAKFAAARRDGRSMQLSAGYTLDLDETPGETADGKHDAVQRNIRINHVAAVPLGRAGTARALDGADVPAAAWEMSLAHALTDIAPHRSVVVFDFGRWCRRDAGELRSMHVHDGKFGDLLSKLAEEKEVTAEELGKAAGISASTVTQIMRGEIDKPPDRRLEGFAKALGVSFARLKGALPKEEKGDMRKIPIHIDGKPVVIEVAADATTEQIATAVGKAHADAAARRDKARQAELDKAVSAAVAQAIADRFGKGPDDDDDDDDKKKDAADLEQLIREHKDELDKVEQRTDALSTARAILGLDYRGDGKDAPAIKLDVIERVLGKNERDDAEADPGAIGYLYRRAVKAHADQPSHAERTRGEILRVRGDATRKDNDGPGPMTQARLDAERVAATPRHERTRKAG